MSNVRKILQMTSLLFGMVILFCYIGWHLGYDGLILIGEIELPWYISYFICKILLFINLALVGSFIMQEYTKNIIFLTIPVVILTGIFDILNLETAISTGPLPIIYFIILSFLFGKKKIKGPIIRSLVITGITIGYQIMAVIFKTGKFTLNSTVSLYTCLMFSIDMIILLLLIWSIGGVKSDKVDHRRMELLVFPGRIRDEKSRNESDQSVPQSTSNIPVGKFEEWVMRSVILVVQILQWIFILWICSFDKLFIDALVITTSFICYGMIISKRKHLKPIILCTLATTAMFYLTARFTISFHYSQFFPILVGLLLVYTMYRISYQIEKEAQGKKKKDLERIKKLEKQIEDAWNQIDDLS